MKKLLFITVIAIIIAILSVNFVRNKKATGSLGKRAPTARPTSTKPAPQPHITSIPTIQPKFIKITQIIYPEKDAYAKGKWGTTEKIAEHTYRTYIGTDERMGTAPEIFAALNIYRKKHGVGTLVEHTDLCRIADMRIDELKKLGGLDAHEGFNKYLSNPENSADFPDFVSLGENNSIGYKQDATHIIEWVFDADEEHRTNQLNPSWTHVCVRVAGTLVEFVFGR